MTLKNVRLARKLALGFGTVLTVVALSSTLMFYQSIRLAEIERLNSISERALDRLDQLDGELNGARASGIKFVFTKSAGDKAGFEDQLSKFFSAGATLRAMLLNEGAELRPEFDAFEKAAKDYLDNILIKEVTLASSPQTEGEATSLIRASQSAVYATAVNQTFVALRGRLSSWSDGWTVQGDQSMTQTLVVVAASGGLSILLGLLMAWVITRAIGRPITAMTRAMKELAEGNNAVAIPATAQKDEIGEMARAVQVFKDAAIPATFARGGGRAGASGRGRRAFA